METQDKQTPGWQQRSGEPSHTRGSVGDEHGQGLEEIWQAGTQVRHDLEHLLEAVQRQRHEVERRIRQRPLVALAAAFGVGFILGGGLASRVGAWLLMSGGRMVAAQAIEHLAARFDQG